VAVSVTAFRFGELHAETLRGVDVDAPASHFRPADSVDGGAAGPAGDFLYRFGDPARYGQGEPPGGQ